MTAAFSCKEALSLCPVQVSSHNDLIHVHESTLSSIRHVIDNELLETIPRVHQTL